jgi:rhamnogalacturonan endolyase
MENLDRGVVAVVVSGGVYVGWRMFGYEYTGTDSDTSYNLYRDGTKVANVTDSTNYLDASGTSGSKYTVSAVLKGVEGPQSAAVTPWADQYKSISLSVPPKGALGGTYTPNDASPGDLDGDGQMDIVLKWDPSNSQDSSFSNKSDDCIIDGIKMDGTKLWRIDLGVNIRAGAHDTQLSVYDFDGDGTGHQGWAGQLPEDRASGRRRQQPGPQRSSRHDLGRTGVADRVRRHDRGGTGNH